MGIFLEIGIGIGLALEGKDGKDKTGRGVMG